MQILKKHEETLALRLCFDPVSGYTATVLLSLS